MTHTKTKTMTETKLANGYDTFLWLELIGFDNTQPDMGVRAYLDGLGFIPTGLSIFMWGPDFVHLHDGLAKDAAFPPDIGAYLDPLYFDKKQPGPAWTKFQLKSLIGELHKYGIEVHFSVFPNSLDNRFHREWISDHPETGVVYLTEVDPWFPMIHPLKRLADGTFYEDFFVRKVTEVACDYGFDGIHLVDGYNHGWYQLWDAEYSDDMVDQFLAHSGVKLPPELPAVCGQAKPALKARAEWIWANRRREWINFHVDRWDVYFRKVTAALHGLGKKVACNTCWTRDPMEAIYRYGIDYQKLQAAGIDRFVVETCGAGGEMLNKVCRARFSVPFFHVIKATSLLTRAYVPDANIVFNNCTQDITEGWSTLRHAPAFLEREIYSYSNLFHYDAAGTPRRTFNGLNVCLAAGMESGEWQWVKARWDSAFGMEVKAVDGLTLVWSDELMMREVDEYIQTRNSMTQNVLYHLLAAGVSIAATVDAKHVDKVAGPLLVINPHLLSEADRQRILKNPHRVVITIGPGKAGGSTLAVVVTDGAETDAMQMGVFGPVKAPIEQKQTPGVRNRIDVGNAQEPASFFDEMTFQPVSDAFYAACADAILKVARPTLALDIDSFCHGEWAGVQSFHKADGGIRSFIWNESFQYVDTRLQADRELTGVKAVSKFRGRPIVPFDGDDVAYKEKPTGRGRRFIVRIPPKGVGVVDLSSDL